MSRNSIDWGDETYGLDEGYDEYLSSDFLKPTLPNQKVDSRIRLEDILEEKRLQRELDDDF